MSINFLLSRLEYVVEKKKTLPQCVGYVQFCETYSFKNGNNDLCKQHLHEEIYALVHMSIYKGHNPQSKPSAYFISSVGIENYVCTLLRSVSSEFKISGIN